jgi:hypothetical protein
MRLPAQVMGAAVALLASAVPAAAEPQFTYRARVSFETRPADIRAATLVVAAADSSWERGRLRLAGGLVAARGARAGRRLVAREAYARISATSWMDIEAGKRLVRWGVGYGFAPTGVLDPPRLATDPTDRLGRQEGLPMARVDVFAGGTSLTIAAASPTRMVAARLRTMLPHGVEVAVIGAAAAHRRPAVGANLTHVVGQRLEWHMEVLSRAGSVSAAAGLQYTARGVNAVIEYHRDQAPASPGSPGGRRVFVRGARAGADVRLAPELILIRSMDDGRWTTVAGVRWTLRQRIEWNARITHTGRPALSFGATVRF